MSTFPNPVSIPSQPPDPPYFGENQPKTLRLYPLSKAPLKIDWFVIIADLAQRTIHSEQKKLNLKKILVSYLV